MHEILIICYSCYATSLYKCGHPCIVASLCKLCEYLRSTCVGIRLIFYPCVLLLATVCPGPPETPSLVSDVPPNPTLSWSPPSASGAWSYTYEVSWTNGSVIVPRQAGTTGQIPGLHAETEYTLGITAYPDSTLCPKQSAIFTLMTMQSKWDRIFTRHAIPTCICEVSFQVC